MEDRRGRLELFLYLCCTLSICLISGISGSQTEVPDDIVLTVLNKNVRKGDTAILPCQFRGSPLAVYWKKGDDPRSAPNLVSWIPTDDVTGLCEGQRPCEIMEMNEDRSLVIKEVGIPEKGRYICRVSNYKGHLIHNFTDITVFSPPLDPFPVINNCNMSSLSNGTSTCTLFTNDFVKINCSANRYYPNIDLYIFHGSKRITTNHSIEVTNPDGTKNKTISANVSPSDIRYVCVASNIPGTQEPQTAIVWIYSPLPTTQSLASLGQIWNTAEPESNTAKIVLPFLTIIFLVVGITAASYYCYKRNQQPVSYVELWILVDQCDLAQARDIVSKIVNEEDCENQGKHKLYESLCSWKQTSSVTLASFYCTLEKHGFQHELRRMKEFRKSPTEVSDDDMAHVCWHVQKGRETVNPILRNLCSTYKKRNPPVYTDCTFEGDFQAMKRWKSAWITSILPGGQLPECLDQAYSCQQGTLSSHSPSNKNNDTEQSPMNPSSEEVEMKLKLSPPNQMILLSLALEEARKTADTINSPLYGELEKTFFQINDLYKTANSDEDFKKFALGITKQHYQKLVKAMKLKETVIDGRNEDDLRVMFRTDSMLKDWVLDQRCSNYETRCKLRWAAERCHRTDVADLIIPKDQSNIMTFPRDTGDEISPKSKCDCKRHGEYISCDEYSRIIRYVGNEPFYEYKRKHGEFPQVQLEGTLTQNVGDIIKKIMISHPRDLMRQILGVNKECLLPKKRKDSIFDVEFIDLAFRLVMSDVYPFAEKLQISHELLTSYRLNFDSQQLRQGTAKLLKEFERNRRGNMSRLLKSAGYIEEAKTVYFGFSISLNDVLEVEKRIDVEKLREELELSNDFLQRAVDSISDVDKLLHSVLRRWRNSVRGSTYNHRLILSDAIFKTGNEELALAVLSGVYREREITTPVFEFLVSAMTNEELTNLHELLDHECSIDAVEKNKRTVLAKIREHVETSLYKPHAERPRSLSNRLLESGFYSFAYEIMAGTWKREQNDSTVREEEEYWTQAAKKVLDSINA